MSACPAQGQLQGQSQDQVLGQSQGQLHDPPPALNPNCPHRLLLDQLTDKWSVLVLTALDGGPARFNAIKRRLAGVTQKALTQALRRLERNGLVARRIVPVSPVAVEYRMTALGRTALPPVLAVYAWTVEHLPAVDRARRAFDAAPGRAPDRAPDGLADAAPGGPDGVGRGA